MSTSAMCRLLIIVNDVFECMFFIPKLTFGVYVRAPPFCQMRNYVATKGNNTTGRDWRKLFLRNF